MVTLPKQVEEAGKKADEILSSQNPDNEPEDATNDDETSILPNDVDDDNDIKQEEDDTLDDEEEGNNDSSQTQDDDVARWEAKYKTLQGKYNAEVPRMAKEIKLLKQELEQAVEKIKLLAVGADKEDETGSTATNKFTPEDYEAYGEEFKAMAEENQRLMEELKQIKQEIKNVKSVSQSSAREQFLSKLDKLEPSWSELNEDSGFNEWLDETDELYGKTRREFFDSAVARMDAKQVAKFFTSYLKKTAKPVADRKKKISSQVQPKRRPTDTSANAGKKEWSRKEIANFYAALARGDYRYREDEANKIEASINKAIAEGNISA